MDRFKTRIWDTKYKCYLVFDIYDGHWAAHKNDPNRRYTYLELFTLSRSFKRFVKEQCTGLKDKNGKLIYEGDVMRIKDIDGERLVISWSEDVPYFHLCGEELCTSEPIDQGIMNGFKVIGNIYENPELSK